MGPGSRLTDTHHTFAGVSTLLTSHVLGPWEIRERKFEPSTREVTSSENERRKVNIASKGFRKERCQGCVGSQFNFFHCLKTCLHLCLLNFRFSSHFANRRYFHFMRHLQISFDLFFTTESVKTPPLFFELS
jgi:hypothetical protein